MIGAGDVLPPEEAAWAFRRLNDLIDLMKTNRLWIYRRQRVGEFTVTSGQGDITANSPITIGTGGMWNTPRPIFIDYAGVIYTAGNTPQPELKMHIFTVEEWRRITVKGITSTLSRALIYDRNFDSSGFGNIYLYPVPSATFKVVLYNPVAMDEFPLDANGNPDFTTVLAMPPGYRPLLISNLSKILCLGVLPVPEDVREQATATMDFVKSSNVITHMDALKCDDATREQDNRTSGWDWIGGGFQ